MQIRHNQNLLKVKQNVTKGECIRCNTSQRLSCQQIVATTAFGSIGIYVIYLLECLLFKIQNVRKSDIIYVYYICKYILIYIHMTQTEDIINFFTKYAPYMVMERLYSGINETN